MPSNRLPSKKECQTALKILTQYERLARKLHKNIPEERLAELNGLRDAEDITINDIPATLGHEFPGVFGNMTLEEIRQLCNQI